MKRKSTFSRLYTLTIYLESGNTIVLDKVEDWSANKDDGGKFTSFHWKQAEGCENRLKAINLDRIEAITQS